MPALEIRYLTPLRTNWSPVVVRKCVVISQRIAAGFGLGQAEGEDLFAAARRGQVIAFLRPRCPRSGSDTAPMRGVPGEEGAHAGPFPADACQRPGDRSRRRPRGRRTRGHTACRASRVSRRQRHDLVVEPTLDVAQFLDRPHFLAERLDIGGQFGGIERHDRLQCVLGEYTVRCGRESGSAAVTRSRPRWRRFRKKRTADDLLTNCLNDVTGISALKPFQHTFSRGVEIIDPKRRDSTGLVIQPDFPAAWTAFAGLSQIDDPAITSVLHMRLVLALEEFARLEAGTMGRSRKQISFRCSSVS